MSTDEAEITQSNEISPYTERWQGHQEVYFLKVGISLKSHEIDYSLNVSAAKQLCVNEKKEVAVLLRRLANDFWPEEND